MWQPEEVGVPAETMQMYFQGRGESGLLEEQHGQDGWREVNSEQGAG